VDIKDRKKLFGNPYYIFRPTIDGAWNAPYITVAVFDIFYPWNSWINAATTRTGTPASCARKWRSPTARNAWITAALAPTPASTANFAKAASSGNSAAKRPGSGVRKKRGKRGKGKKAKRVKKQSLSWRHRRLACALFFPRSTP
jgi:hypothetical protein